MSVVAVVVDSLVWRLCCQRRDVGYQNVSVSLCSSAGGEGEGTRLCGLVEFEKTGILYDRYAVCSAGQGCSR